MTHIPITQEQLKELNEKGEVIVGAEDYPFQHKISIKELVCPRCGKPADNIWQCYDGCRLPRSDCCNGGNYFPADISCIDCDKIAKVAINKIRARDELGIDGPSGIHSEMTYPGYREYPGVSCRYCILAKKEGKKCEYHDTDYQINVGPGAPYANKIPDGYSWEH